MNISTNNPYLRLMRVDKPIGTLLLLWPTLWALWIAGDGHPQPGHILIFVIGVIVMRAAGCVINDIADRHIDGHVARTVGRPLATGEVTTKKALMLFVLLSAIGASLLFWLNALACWIAVSALGLAIIYPFTKRFLVCPQLVLGAAWYLGMLMAFAAEQGVVPPLAWLIYVAAIIWTIAFDTEYAMVDREDDIRLGLKSTAILFGAMDRLMVAILLGIFLLIMLWVAILLTFSWPFYIFFCLACCCACYQLCLIKARHPQGCFAAFLNNNLLGLLLFLAIFCNYMIIK